MLDTTLDIYDQIAVLPRISSRLTHFKARGHRCWYFRCPYCGDSQRNPFKTRANIFVYEEQLYFKCFNCPEKKPFLAFLKELDAPLYRQVFAEKFSETKNSRKSKVDLTDKLYTPEIKSIEAYEEVPGAHCIATIAEMHPAKIYIKGRKIPKRKHQDLFFIPSLNPWMAEHYSDVEVDRYPRDAVIAIPFFYPKRGIIGYQFRLMFPDPRKPKYYTLKLVEDVPLVYGYDEYDPTQTSFACEGPIDSMFIPNCMAAANSDIQSTISKLKDVIDPIMIFDNEPRNKEIGRVMLKAAKANARIFIWPSTVSVKDINDWAMFKDPHTIVTTIKQNAFRGLHAILKMKQWESNG